VGSTTVNCTATNGVAPNAICSFTVTVIDNQPPVIICPSDITIKAANPNDATVVVNYATPSVANGKVSDNCGIQSVVCNPPSGSAFPVGQTEVKCKATDTSGNMASCTFKVTAYDVCLQDDSNAARVLLFNSFTGDYVFCCDGLVLTGQGKVKKKGGEITLEDNTTNRRVLGKVTAALRKGTASVQSPPGTPACTITDRDFTNNDCNCTPTGP